LGVGRLLEAAFESWVELVPFRFAYLQLAHDWGANRSLAKQNRECEDLSVRPFEIKELSQAEVARL
jgi:hypothetical protein